MSSSHSITPMAWKDRPALIEQLFPVQKLSAESYKEQMAGSGKTLTALGSYWKGRKPLILNKACVLGCLLPVTDNPSRDLEIFEMLMGMDDTSLRKRLRLREEHPLPEETYSQKIGGGKRPEEIMATVHTHIWPEVNAHLGTQAGSFPELVEQMGILRFGHRPRVADTFCGSGQIPFEAARLGCDVYASDLNPVACMLTWGAFNIVGGSPESREQMQREQEELVQKVQAKIDELGIETDGNGWKPKSFLYCIEVKCSQSGWKVPMMVTRVINPKRKVIAILKANKSTKSYDILVKSDATQEELASAESGTIVREGRYGEAYLSHTIEGETYKTRISTLRGDRWLPNGKVENDLRAWGINDFKPRDSDLLQERLYCIQWMRLKENSSRTEYDYRSVTEDDIEREKTVEAEISSNLLQWQDLGLIPDIRIEPGEAPRYQGMDLLRSRGWHFWHHAFTPRMLLIGALIRKEMKVYSSLAFNSLLNCNSKMSRWHARNACVAETFDNQALNTLYNYASQSFTYSTRYFKDRYDEFPILSNKKLEMHRSQDLNTAQDIFITDPPYGDAVKYEEITDFFISWFRRNPPAEFKGWTWDSRRALAIKGEGEEFRQQMVAAYRNMTEHMPDNGMQVIMFTHKSNSIWADLAGIVWASGLQVTAAWYVTTETESALRGDNSNVKGTVLLVARKRVDDEAVFRDELVDEVSEVVADQMTRMMGLNENLKQQGELDSLYADEDLQMASYAAALRVLTRYRSIDGSDMTREAERPRVRGQKTLVDEIIEYATQIANELLVPDGIAKTCWEAVSPAERFYLRMLDQEGKGNRKLESYINFARALRVTDYAPLMASTRANDARLKLAVEFGRTSLDGEFGSTPLRAILFALREMQSDVDLDDVAPQLRNAIPEFFELRQKVVLPLLEYLARKREGTAPDEAAAARVLLENLKQQRLGG